MQEVEILDQIRVLYNQGWTQQKIGEYFGYSKSWAERRTQKLGLRGYHYDHKFFEPSQRQEDILVGTMLGDGHLALRGKFKNARLTLGHGSDQKEYLYWKVDQFGSLFMAEPRQRRHLDKRTGKIYWSWRCRSRCHPWLTEWHRIFYPDGKTKIVTEEILSYVNDLALALWWMDDGRTPNGGYGFCAGRLTISEYELIQSWFSAQGFDPNLSWKSNDSVTFTFRKRGSIHFRERIEPYIPESMLFKFNRCSK